MTSLRLDAPALVDSLPVRFPGARIAACVRLQRVEPCLHRFENLRLRVLAHADDERKAVPRAVARIEIVEESGFLRIEPVEAGASLFGMRTLRERARANRFAVARPMPLAAPVMKMDRRPFARALPLAAMPESP